jgi:hypothetical protein
MRSSRPRRWVWPGAKQCLQADEQLEKKGLDTLPTIT